MKNLKTAAVAAGTLAIAGAAVPASAVEPSGHGLIDNGKTVARSLPNAAKLPTGYVESSVKHTADRVKTVANESGVVRTPVFGGTLPNPIGGQLLGGLPLNR